MTDQFADKKFMNKDKAMQIFLASTLFIMVFFGFYFVFNEIGREKDLGSEAVVDIRQIERRIDDAVNQHLRSVDTERRMRDLMVSARNLEMTENFKKKAGEWNPSPEQVGIYDQDLSHSGSRDYSSMTIEEKLRLEMEQQKREAKEKAESKKQYIEAYKLNALKDGWVVEINDNLEIISAKRVNESN